jgi:hypothetical protein
MQVVLRLSQCAVTTPSFNYATVGSGFCSFTFVLKFMEVGSYGICVIAGERYKLIYEHFMS